MIKILYVFPFIKTYLRYYQGTKYSFLSFFISEIYIYVIAFATIFKTSNLNSGFIPNYLIYVLSFQMIYEFFYTINDNTKNISSFINNYFPIVKIKNKELIDYKRNDAYVLKYKNDMLARLVIIILTLLLLSQLTTISLVRLKLILLYVSIVYIFHNFIFHNKYKLVSFNQLHFIKIVGPILMFSSINTLVIVYILFGILSSIERTKLYGLQKGFLKKGFNNLEIFHHFFNPLFIHILIMQHKFISTKIVTPKYLYKKYKYYGYPIERSEYKKKEINQSYNYTDLDTYKPWHRLPKLILKEYSQKRFKASLLEIGSGNGLMAEYASELGFATSALEHDKYCQKLIRNRNKNIEIFDSVSSISKRKFDVILLCEVIEHQDEIKKFVQTIKDHLHNNGIVILTTPNISRTWRIFNLKCEDFDYQPNHKWRFSFKNIDLLFQSIGFKNYKLQSAYEIHGYQELYYRLRTYKYLDKNRNLSKALSIIFLPIYVSLSFVFPAHIFAVFKK